MATPVVIVCDGDSITLGTGYTWAAYPQLIIAKQLSNIYNVGVGSETLATMLTNAPTVVDTKLGTSGHDTVIIWGGTNDIAIGGQTAAQTYATLTSYVAARFAAGWHNVIVVEAVSRITVDSTIQAYNALITANSAGATAVVTLPSTLTGVGAFSNTAYFRSDGIHPIQYSNNTIIAPAILSVLNNLNTVSGPYSLPAPLFQDNFTYSNPGGTTDYPAGDIVPLHTANANWVFNAGTPYAIDGGVGGGVNAFCSYQGVQPTANQQSRVIIGNTAMRVGPAVRLAASAATGYVCRPESATTFAVYKCVTGTFTQLGVTTTTALNQGDELLLVANGTTISVFKNGTQVFTATDAAIASGFGGMFFGGNAVAASGQMNAGAMLFAVDNFPATPAIGPVTPGTVLGVFSGANIAQAFSNPGNQDLIQVINEGNKVVWNLASNGVASANPVSPTPHAVLGKFFGASFVAAFPSLNNFNLLQIVARGNSVVFRVDYLGNAG